MTVSVRNMQLTLSMAITQVTTSASLHEIEQKTFKSVITGLHFTTFVNILPKLRYFEGRNDIQIGYKSYSVLSFPDRPMKGGNILDFYKGGGGGDEPLTNQGGGGYEPLTNYGLVNLELVYSCRLFFSNFRGKFFLLGDLVSKQISLDLANKF